MLVRNKILEGVVVQTVFLVGRGPVHIVSLGLGATALVGYGERFLSGIFGVLVKGRRHTLAATADYGARRSHPEKNNLQRYRWSVLSRSARETSGSVQR